MGVRKRVCRRWAQPTAFSGLKNRIVYLDRADNSPAQKTRSISTFTHLRQKAAQRPTRPLQARKPFAGLTHKPLCAACEYTEAHGHQAPTALPALMAST